MTEDKIKVTISDDAGNVVVIPTPMLRIQAKLDIVIAQTFTEINTRINNIADDDGRTSAKFDLAQTLALHLGEINNGKLD